MIYVRPSVEWGSTCAGLIGCMLQLALDMQWATRKPKTSQVKSTFRGRAHLEPRIDFLNINTPGLCPGFKRSCSSVSYLVRQIEVSIGRNFDRLGLVSVLQSRDLKMKMIIREF